MGTHMSEDTVGLTGSGRAAIQEGVAEPAPSLAAWLAFGTAQLFIFYQLALQTLPSVIREGLVVNFSLTESGFGSLSASFYYPHMLLQIPAGLLILRFGSRRLLVAGLALCILASLITASLQNVGHVAIARVLMGLGATPSFVATMALVTRWFPSRHFPMLVAATETIGMPGAAPGQEILGFVIQSTGWRTGMMLCAAFGIVVLVMTFLFVHDAPDGATEGADAPRPRPLRERLKALLAPSLILAGLIGGVVGAGLGPHTVVAAGPQHARPGWYLVYSPPTRQCGVVLIGPAPPPLCRRRRLASATRSV